MPHYEQGKLVPEEQDWYFTFGSGRENAQCYTIRHGTFDSARQQMFTDYGMKWACQYSTPELAGVKKFNLRKI